MKTGVLSRYLGVWDPDFYGGPKIQEFEKAIQKYFEDPLSEEIINSNIKEGETIKFMVRGCNSGSFK